jgi:predicted AAA+ superfamily ATPase
MFETWVVNEILRQSKILAMPPQAYHWRTGGGAEVDIILERDGKLYPVEVKCKSNLTGHDTRGLRSFRETYRNGRIMTGLIVHAGSKSYRVDEHTFALPWNVKLHD